MNKIAVPKERRKEKRSKIHSGVEKIVCLLDVGLSDEMFCLATRET